MQTIRLRINEKIYKNLMWFLKKFSEEELQIINEDEKFVSVQEYLEKELQKVDKGNIEFFDLEQLDKKLEATIGKHED